MNIYTITLNNGVTMPRLGLGLFQVSNDEAEKVVSFAIGVGYRSIDTATYYNNEEAVGRALRTSGLPRDQVFVTTKLWLYDHGYDATLRAFNRSLGQMGLEYVDLYLMHCPLPGKHLDTWRAFERLLADGQVRAIGVANFSFDYLMQLVDQAKVLPMVNQIESHPYYSQAKLRAFNAEHGIVTQAWSPLRQARELLDDPVLLSIACKHARTPAQVVLRWHLQLGNMMIPKSVTPSRIVENSQIFDFALDAEDMREIGALDQRKPIGPDITTFDFATWRPPRYWTKKV